MPKKFDVISIGSSLRDTFLLNKDLSCTQHKVCHPFNPAVVGDKIKVKKMYFDIGGGGSNTAATFANMGLKTALFSQIGDDLTGKEVLKIMGGFGVNLSLINIRKKAETGYSVFFIDKNGERTALIYRGASQFDKQTKVPKSELRANWFFITSVGGNSRLLKDIFVVGEKNKTKIAWNPGNDELKLGGNKLKPLLQKAAVLFVNLEEAQLLTKNKNKDVYSLLQKLNKLTSGAIVCLTNGKAGAWVQKDKEIIYANILNKIVVNATGAGDAFGSGFVSGLILYRGDIKKSLQLAMLNSNGVVTQMGAKHGLLKKRPSEKELNKIKIKEVK